MRNISENTRFGQACMEAIAVRAEAEKSDPFAAARLACYLRNGIEDDPEQIVKDDRVRVNLRKEQVLRDYEKWKAEQDRNIQTN